MEFLVDWIQAMYGHNAWKVLATFRLLHGSGKDQGIRACTGQSIL